MKFGGVIEITDIRKETCLDTALGDRSCGRPTMRACFLAIATLLGGCTTSLNTRPMASQATGGTVGMRYALPALQYSTTVTRRVTKCVETADGLSLEFDVTVDAKPELVDGEWFTVDYTSLGSWSKTSSFEMHTYENQTLKSFNAKADDQSAEIAAGVVKAGFSVARLAMGVPGDLAGGGGLTCPTNKLESYDQLEQALKTKTKELEGLTASLEPWLAQALIGTLSEAGKIEITELRKQSMAKSKEITDIRKKMDELAKSLSWVEVHPFLPDWRDDGAGLNLILDFPSRRQDVRKLQIAWAEQLFGGAPTAGQLADIGKDMKTVVVTARAADSPAVDTICTQANVEGTCAAPVRPKWNNFVSDTADPKPAAIPGIAYRTPVRGRLTVCRGVTPQECVTGNDPSAVLSRTNATFPQLGRLGILPFRNGFSQDNELSATFRPDGSIETASYSEKRARGKAVVDLVNGSLDQALALDQAIRTRNEEEKKEAEGAVVAELDRQITEEKKRLELLQAQWATDQENVAALHEIDRQKSLIAQLQNEKTLKELGYQPGDPVI